MSNFPPASVRRNTEEFSDVPSKHEDLRLAAVASANAPYQMKEQDTDAKRLKPTTKSYNNLAFMASQEARTIRILCEFQEPAARLREHNIRGTILVFGSARSMARADFDATMSDLTKRSNDTALTEDQRREAKDSIGRFQKVEWMCEWVDVIEELCRRLTEWTMHNKDVITAMNNLPDYFFGTAPFFSDQPLVVTTGGGPGLMEAANRGASKVPGAKTMGMGISLPFEKGLNPHVSDGLEFEFHYFFTRKFWMMYSAKALILAPGGFGTLDELFELLTLRQTKKVPDLPIVLIGSHYWKTIINWQAMADMGTISQKEVDSLCFADDVETAFNFITERFTPDASTISPALKGLSPGTNIVTDLTLGGN